MRIVRWFFGMLVLAGLAFAAAYYYAGTLDGPTITINQPSVIGQGGTLDVTVDAPGGELSALNIQVEQKGRTFPVFDIVSAPPDAVVTNGDRVRITRPIGKKTLPDLVSGPATLKVSASRLVFRKLRQVSSEASRDMQVRLTPPRVAVVSTHHYVNQGGAEMIVYRVTPPDAESGVRVGDVTYPGFPASGARMSDPELKVAFFALLYNQAPNAPMEVFARDIAGNEARAQFEHRVFPKKFRNSRIPLDDKFLSRVVPAILQSSPQLQTSANELLPAFLKINNDLRRMNNDTIGALARRRPRRFSGRARSSRLAGRRSNNCRFIVGRAISAREAVLLSIIVHLLLIIFFQFGPDLNFLRPSPEDVEARRQELLRQQEQDLENRRFVFVQPQIDMKAPEPKPHVDLSDLDRRAQAPQH